MARPEEFHETNSTLDVSRSRARLVILAYVSLLASCSMLVCMAAPSTNVTARDAPTPSTGMPATAAELVLHWQAPPECPTMDDVLERASQHLGADEPTDAAEVFAHVEWHGNGYRLSLEIRADAPLPAREIPAPDCNTLANATALIAAAALDPVATDPSLGVSRAPTVASDVPAPLASPTAPRPPRPHEPLVTVPRDSRERSRDTRGMLRSEVGLGGGELPVGAGLGLALGLGGRGWDAELGGTYWVPRHLLQHNLRLGLATAVVRGCGTPTHARWSLPICGGIEAGPMVGKSGDIASERGRSLWVAAVFGVGARLSLTSGIAFIARGEVAIALRQPSFGIRGIGIQHSAGSAAGRGFFGVELRFP